MMILKVVFISFGLECPPRATGGVGLRIRANISKEKKRRYLKLNRFVLIVILATFCFHRGIPYMVSHFSKVFLSNGR